MFTDPNRKGDMAEHWVALLAAWKGAEVFKNINCTGKTDLILKYNGNLYEIDVKLARKSRENGGWFTDANMVKPPVIPVLVIPSNDICDWKVKWIRGRHPPELADFWSKNLSTTVDATHKIKDTTSEETI